MSFLPIHLEQRDLTNRSSHSVPKKPNLVFNLRLTPVDGTLTLFTTKTQDEILPYELDAFPGQNFYRNIGEVNRKGIEITTVIKMTKATSANLAYTYGTFTARDDKELPNVPNQQFSMGLIHLFGATRLAVDIRHIGKRFANSNNTVEIPKFWTLDMYAQRRFGQVTGSAGITNLTKPIFMTTSASMLLVVAIMSLLLHASYLFD